MRRIAGARGLRGRRWNPEALEDAAGVAHVDNRCNDPQAAMAFCAVQNVDVEGAAEKLRPRKPWRRRVEQAAEKARPMADANGVRREKLHVGKPIPVRREGKRAGAVPAAADPLRSGAPANGEPLLGAGRCRDS